MTEMIKPDANYGEWLADAGKAADAVNQAVDVWGSTTFWGVVGPLALMVLGIGWRFLRQSTVLGTLVNTIEDKYEQAPAPAKETLKAVKKQVAQAAPPWFSAYVTSVMQKRVKAQAKAAKRVTQTPPNK